MIADRRSSEIVSKAISDRDGGLVYDAGKLTVGEYLKLWLADSVKGVAKETTYTNYAYIKRVHVSPALGHVKLRSLTPAHVRSFYGEKPRTQLSAATVKKMHVVLRKSLAQAVSDGLIPRNAAEGVRPPRVSSPGEEIKPLDHDGCAAFLEAARGERLEALYVVAVHCGLRQGELLALHWEDVDLGREARIARQADADSWRGWPGLGNWSDDEVRQRPTSASFPACDGSPPGSP